MSDKPVIRFKEGALTPTEQQVVSDGFSRDTVEQGAPAYENNPFNWLAYDDAGTIIGALTGYTLWDWVYMPRVTEFYVFGGEF